MKIFHLIQIFDKKASRIKPQAWSKDIDGQEHWVYNVPAILAEAKFLFPEEIKTLYVVAFSFG